MIAKIRLFFSEVKAEMQKVTWSNREELINSTAVVLVTIAFLSIFIGIVDVALTYIMRAILG